jgi:hypothetical protein
VLEGITPLILTYNESPNIGRIPQRLIIAILATISGAEHFTEMEEFGQAKQDWLKTFLE